MRSVKTVVSLQCFQGFWLEVPAAGIFQLKCLEKGLDSGKLQRDLSNLFDTDTFWFTAAELVCYPWMEEGEQSHLQVVKNKLLHLSHII